MTCNNESFGIFLVLNVLFCGIESSLKLVWSDEFDGKSLDETKWNYQSGGNGWANDELEFYTEHRQENARVEKGHLVIDVIVENYRGKNFTSARLSTIKGWTFGKFNIRAKLPKGKHLWPSIWMMPLHSKYGAWAASGEIDIMQSRGDKNTIIDGQIHYGGSWPNMTSSGSGQRNMNIDLSANWHIYGLEWDRKTIRWYFDGKEYHKQNINRNMWSQKGRNPYKYNGSPFDQPFYLIVDVAVGGNFFPKNIYGLPVTPNEAKHWPKPTMEIDYIRVYQ